MTLERAAEIVKKLGKKNWRESADLFNFFCRTLEVKDIKSFMKMCGWEGAAEFVQDPPNEEGE